MRTRTVSLVLSLCLLAVLPTSAAGANSAKPVVVGTDDAGDWGSGVDPGISPLGDAVGQDLVEASVGMADKSTINFIIKVNALPPTGGIPEFTRYNWDLYVDGEPFQLTGGFTEYLRGTCNPLHTDSCPPPQDPGQGAFFVRQGPCTVGADCFVLDIVNAEFDAGEGTITIPVPLEVVGGKPGSKIAPGATIFGGTVYAAPAALVSQASLPHDIMMVDKTYTVPGGKKKKKR